MTKRLRDQGQADAVSEVSGILETLEREMTLTNETIRRSYEAKALEIKNKELDGCISK